MIETSTLKFIQQPHSGGYSQQRIILKPLNVISQQPNYRFNQKKMELSQPRNFIYISSTTHVIRPTQDTILPSEIVDCSHDNNGGCLSNIEQAGGFRIPRADGFFLVKRRSPFIVNVYPLENLT